MIFLMYLLLRNLKKYLNCARELNRISSITRSPIITVITETSAGNIYIKYFEQKNYFFDRLTTSFNTYFKTLSNKFVNNYFFGKYF